MRLTCLRLLSVLLLLTVFKAASAQNTSPSKIDSLLHKLQGTMPDTNQVILLNKLIKAYDRENPSRALSYAKQQFALALKINYVNGELNAYKNLGNLYSRFGDYPAAIKFYEKAYDILRGKKLVAQQYRLLLTIGVYYRFNKQYEEALKRFYILYNYYKSKPGVVKSHNIYVDESWQAVAWQISIAYNAQGNNKAVENFLSGILNDYQQKKDADGVLSAQILIAGYYSNLKQNYTVGIAKYQEVLRKYKINDTTREYGELLQSLAYVYVNLNLYDKAMETYQKGNLIYYKKDLKQAQQDNNDFLHRIYERTEDYNKSLQLDIKSLKTDSAAKDQIDLVYDYTSIGSDYLNLKNYPKALIYAKKASALNDLVHTYGSGNADLLQLITEIYYRSHNYANAFPAAKKMLSAQIFNSEVRYQCILLSGMIVRDAPPEVLVNNGINAARRFNEALKNINQALTFAHNNHALALARDCYLELSTTYEMQKNYKSFHDTYKQYIVMRDSVANQGNQNALNSKLLQTQFDKQADSLKFSAQITRTRLHTKQVQSYYFIGGIIILLALSFFVYRSYKKADFEKHRSDELLLNILPADVAEELKEKGSADARLFDEVTVLFTDFVNFTKVSELLSPQELVDELNVCFREFDGIMTTHNIEKIKTVGDAYLAVAGLPHADLNHAANVIKAAREIQQFMIVRKLQMGDKSFGIRIGIHSGSVVAGIVGVKKFAYDIWGDTVNTAARMEQNSHSGKINVSEKTYELVKDQFTFTYRGEIAAKNKGMMKMYFAENL